MSLNNELDNELHGALKRREPSPDFVARTMARISLSESAGTIPPPAASWRVHRPGVWVAASLAASLIIAAGATRVMVHRQEARDAEHAKHEIEIGLQIASRTLQQMQVRLAEISHNQGEANGPNNDDASR